MAPEPDCENAVRSAGVDAIPPPAAITRKTGDEPFHAAGTRLPFDLRSFWQWFASDLVGNALRGLIAEYLVARALGAADGIRVEWDACDVRAPDGLRVEVKASGRVQSWPQAKPSAATFDIAPKRAWDAATNTYAPAPTRAADVYVFVVHAHEDRATLDPLDVNQWEFYVLPTRVLDQRCRAQKRIGLASLLRLSPQHASWSDLAHAIIDARAC